MKRGMINPLHSFSGPLFVVTSITFKETFINNFLQKLLLPEIFSKII